MRKVRVLEAAASEVVEAAAWYEERNSGLGQAFGRAVDAALDLLESDGAGLVPLPGVAGTRGLQRLVMKRFPYDVVVVERSATEVLVVAFAHHSRHPGYWRGRLSAATDDSSAK